MVKSRNIGTRKKIRVLWRQQMKCNICSTGFMSREWDIDHVIPIFSGGTNDIDNLQALCLDCHREKTRDDMQSGNHPYQWLDC